jgi:hypothetical protein
MLKQSIVPLLAITSFTGQPLLAQARQPELPATFAAFAVSTGGPRTPAVASQVDITINRWSTQAETQRLTAVLKDRGPEHLRVGKLALATKVTVSKDGNTVELENYDAQPIALNEVRRKGK